MTVRRAFFVPRVLSNCALADEDAVYGLLTGLIDAVRMDTWARFYNIYPMAGIVPMDMWIECMSYGIRRETHFKLHFEFDATTSDTTTIRTTTIEERFT